MLLAQPVLPFNSVLNFCLTLNTSHKVYRWCMESLETEILALLRRFDILNEEHRDELCVDKTKYQSKIEDMKTVDSKFLNFSSQEE